MVGLFYNENLREIKNENEFWKIAKPNCREKRKLTRDFAKNILIA